jgi:hypothetical protein
MDAAQASEGRRSRELRGARAIARAGTAIEM